MIMARLKSEGEGRKGEVGEREGREGEEGKSEFVPPNTIPESAFAALTQKLLG